MNNVRTHYPFIKDILKEADRFKRQEKLRHANQDQINAISELTLNFLKQTIPVSKRTVGKLRRHRDLLRNLSNKKSSTKKRKESLIQQKGAGFWKGLDEVCQCLVKKKV